MDFNYEDRYLVNWRIISQHSPAYHAVNSTTQYDLKATPKVAARSNRQILLAKISQSAFARLVSPCVYYGHASDCRPALGQ